MYTGKYEVQKPTRKKRKKPNLIPAFLLVVLLISICILVLIKAMEDAPDSTAGQGSTAGTTTEETTLPKDQVPPEISGVKDITLYMGGTVAYRSGVTVTDDEDPAPQLMVDSSEVDLATPGVYQVVYTAQDAAGNQAQETATITVLLKKAEFVELEAVYQAADKLIAQIIKPEHVTARQKVHAIYAWARSSIGYAGHSDRTDWRQTAYNILQNKQGDCYGYFAVTKLLFERLEIPNIDVQKVRNYADDSDHFWSLVSIDGGESYYHFDATPRIGDGDDFCLVTDTFLDAYSNAHKKCHNRDSSLYPATPKEDLP